MIALVVVISDDWLIAIFTVVCGIIVLAGAGLIRQSIQLSKGEEFRKDMRADIKAIKGSQILMEQNFIAHLNIHSEGD